MTELLNEHTEVSYGVCPQCGRRIVLPCLACRIEAFRNQNRTEHRVPSDDLTADLAICLKHPGQQQRYEEVRNFRDEHGYPMWSARWFDLFSRPFRSDAVG